MDDVLEGSLTPFGAQTVACAVGSPKGNKRSSQHRRSSISYQDPPASLPEQLLLVALASNCDGGRYRHDRARRFSQLAASLSFGNLRLPDCSSIAPQVPPQYKPEGNASPSQCNNLAILSSPTAPTAGVDGPPTPFGNHLPVQLQRTMKVKTASQVSTSEAAQTDAVYQVLELNPGERLLLQRCHSHQPGLAATHVALPGQPPCKVAFDGVVHGTGTGDDDAMQPSTPDSTRTQLQLPKLARRSLRRATSPTMLSSSIARTSVDTAEASKQDDSHSSSFPKSQSHGPCERRLQFRRSSLHLSYKGMDLVVETLRRSYDTLPHAGARAQPASGGGENLVPSGSIRGQAHRRLSSYILSDKPALLASETTKAV